MYPSVFHKKRLLQILLGITLLIWLIWYMTTYASRQKEVVLLAAAPALSCPASEIRIGSSHQEGDDGPTRFSVEGCSREVTILCDDYGSRRGFIKQYFAFDIVCRAL